MFKEISSESIIPDTNLRYLGNIFSSLSVMNTFFINNFKLEVFSAFSKSKGFSEGINIKLV